ncbi:MAG: hypothetical protein ABI182_04660, partial [Candidatus Baltobacteraceae bacterium]
LRAIHRVGVSCRFCRTAGVILSKNSPAADSLSKGEPLVFIIHRYDALISDIPTPNDIASLPYAHIESAVALKPFTVLTDSAAILAGPQISDRGLQPTGALILDAGVPNYDVAAGVSPFLTTPSHYIAQITADAPSAGFRYGDQAAGGTYGLTPQDPDQPQVAGYLGDDQILRFGTTNSAGSLVFGSSDNAIEHRRRADLSFSQPIADGAIDESASSASNRLDTSFGDSLDNSFDAARLRITQSRKYDLHAEATLDRGTYGASLGPTDIVARWADTAAEIGLQTRGTTSLFGSLGYRLSSGSYDAESNVIPEISAQLQQGRVVAGVHLSAPGYDVLAGVGMFSVGYTGGIVGFPQPAALQFATPSVRLQVAPSDRWSATVSADASFRLPTLLERYGIPPADSSLVLDRNRLLEATIAYTDTARVRTEVTTYTQSTSGLDQGSTTGTGASVAWQFAPTLSVRAWMLRFADTRQPYEPLLRFGSVPQGATVASLWLTYENDSRFRIDALYRRDLLDGVPTGHVDASLSAPLRSGLRWYIGTEQRHNARYVDAGLRLGP